MNQNCTIVRMDFRNLDQASADPKLAALLADGWTVASSLAIEDGNSMSWVLLLAPPLPKPERRVMPDVLVGVALVMSVASVVFSLVSSLVG